VIPRLGYVPALDGIRGVAIAAVVLNHFLGRPGGFFGVDLFFVLSGFLITTLLLEEHASSGRISFRRFYERRARRLFPGLAAMLFVCLLVVALSAGYGYLDVAWTRLEAIAACAFYAGNIVQIFDHAFPGELTPLWSLAQEEQFYLVWPVALLVLLRIGLTPRRLATLLLSLAVSIIAWRAYLAWTHGPVARIYFGPDTHSDGLVLGSALAALRLAGIPRQIAGLARTSAPVLLGFAFVVLAVRSSTWAYALGFPVVEAIGLVLVLNGLGGRARLLSWRPLVWLGSISYGTYLWQGPVLLLLGPGIVAAFVSIALGYASTRWIEAPFRARRRARLAGMLAPAVVRPAPSVD
jgi:peptidoglycan/LPS O-acetylase OafA/YrhL